MSLEPRKLKQASLALASIFLFTSHYVFSQQLHTIDFASNGRDRVLQNGAKRYSITSQSLLRNHAWGAVNINDQQTQIVYSNCSSENWQLMPEEQEFFFSNIRDVLVSTASTRLSSFVDSNGFSPKLGLSSGFSNSAPDSFVFANSYLPYNWI